MSKLEANTIDTVSGTTNLTIGSTNTSTVTFESGAATGHMNPSFKARLATDQTPGTTGWNKIQANTEDWDTDNAYDTSNYRFTVPAGMGGKYHFDLSLRFDSASDQGIVQVRLYINGTQHDASQARFTASGTTSVQMKSNYQVNLSAGDYVELYGYAPSTSQDFGGGTESTSCTWFAGYRIGA